MTQQLNRDAKADRRCYAVVDTIQPANNRFTVVNQWTYQTDAVAKRFDVVFLVNGLPYSFTRHQE